MKIRKILRIVALSLIVLLAAVLVGGISVFRANEVQAPKVRDEAAHKESGEKETEATKLNITDPQSVYVLVNKNNPLNPLEYRPADLVADVVPTTASDSKDERSVRELVKADLVQMFADAKSSKLNLVMNSGFRSSTEQAFYYNNYVRQSGELAANKFSARPGYSEHQTGLSLDISYADRSCYLEECFGETEAGKWLAANAHKYGFILRYPKEKEDITGYQYEPWHFRYVGKDVASKIFGQNLTYEEYLAKLNLIKI